MRTRMFITGLAWLVLTSPLLAQPRSGKRSAARPSSPTQTTTVQPAFDPDAIKKPTVYPSMDSAQRRHFWLGKRVVILKYNEYDTKVHLNSAQRVRRYQPSEKFEDISKIDVQEFLTNYLQNAAPAKEYTGRTAKIAAIRSVGIKTYSIVGPDQFHSLTELLLEVERPGGNDKPEQLVTWVDDYSAFGFADEMELAKTFVGKHFWNRDNSFYDSRGRHITSLDVPGKKLTVTGVEWRENKPFIRVRVKGGDGAEAYIDGARECFDNRYHGNCEVHFTDEKRYDFQDPRKKFPHWTPQMWRLIESRKGAVGMTLDMLKLTCSDLEQERMIFDTRSKQAAAVYFGCGPWKYLVVNGRVKAVH